MKKILGTKQGGFTLVELAVVMVIIGILLSAILKGQDLIDNARAKLVLSQMKNIEAQVWAYYDRQGRFPGDCDDSGFMGLTEAISTAGSPIVALASAASPLLLSCGTGATAPTTSQIDGPISDLRAEHLLDFVTPNDEVTLHKLRGEIRPTHIGATTARRNVIIVYDIPQWMGESIDAAIDGDVDGEAGRIRYFLTNVSAGAEWPARTAANLNVAVLYYFDKI